jgi:hypothetical protein
MKVTYRTNWDSLVGIATGYGLNSRGYIPDGGKVFLSFIAFTPALVPTKPPTQWVQWALSPEVKRLGREAYHSTPFIAEVKNGGVTPPLPHTSTWLSA